MTEQIQKMEPKGPDLAVTEISRIHELDQVQQQKLLELLSATPLSDFAIENITSNGPINLEYFLNMSGHKQIYTRFGLFDKNSQESEKEILTSIFTYHGFLAYCINHGKSAFESINHIGGEGYQVVADNDIRISQELQNQIKSRINLSSLKSAYKIIRNNKYTLSEDEQNNLDNIVTALSYIKFRKTIESRGNKIVDVDTSL